MKFVNWKLTEDKPPIPLAKTKGLPPMRPATHGLQGLSDETLLSRAAEGDTDALSLIFDRYQQPLYRFLRRQTTDAALAEDLVQDTFLRLLEAPKKRTVRHAKAYVYRIALHLAYDVSRRRRLETRHRESLVEPENTKEAAFITLVEERDLLDTAMALLSEKLRTAIALHYFADLSITEIAKTLKIPQGTVKSRLGRGYRQLAELLEGGRP